MVQRVTQEYELIIQTCLLAVLLLVVVLGNSLICAIVWKFKNLRTHANFFVVEMAVTDFLNGTINIPLFICYELFPSPTLTGRTVAMICLFIRRGCLLQNVLSVSTIFVDRYLALAYGLRYTAWKTRKIIFWIVTVKWLIGLAVVGAVILFHTDFEVIEGNARIARYIAQYEDRGIMPFPRIILPSFLIFFCVVSFLSWLEIKKTLMFRRAIQGANIKRFQDLRALKTVRYIIICYAICILPGVTRSILLAAGVEIERNWLLFCEFFFLLITCAVNCIIYYARTERFRRALLVFLTSPFEKNQVVVELKTFDKVIPKIVKEAKEMEQMEPPTISDEPAHTHFTTKSSSESRDFASRDTEESVHTDDNEPSCWDTKL